MARYILRYGFAPLSQCNEEGEPQECEVIDYIVHELTADEVTITHPAYARLIADAQKVDRNAARQYGTATMEKNLPRLQEELQAELNEIYSQKEPDPKLLKIAEERFQAACEKIRYEAEIAYIGHSFINSDDITISSLAIELMSDMHQLSKIHTKYQNCQHTDN